MDLSSVKELSEKFASLYINSLPKLQEFEQERRKLSKSSSIQNQKLFKFKVKSYFLSAIKEIFGIESWEKGTHADKYELLKIIHLCDIEEYHYSNKSGIHLASPIEEVITGSYKGVSYRIWDMVDRLIIEFDSNKTFEHFTSIYTKGIINKKLVMMICITIIASLCFVYMVRILIISPHSVDLETIVKGVCAACGWLYLTISAILTYKKRKNVLEDPKFSKKYYVYSTDPVEARYLLTTSFMERFKTLEKVLKTRRIQCIFNHNKIYFAIYSYTNRFELVNIIEKIDSPKQFRRFFNDLTTIIGMIDSFKFDEKTGL